MKKNTKKIIGLLVGYDRRTFHKSHIGNNDEEIRETIDELISEGISVVENPPKSGYYEMKVVGK